MKSADILDQDFQKGVEEGYFTFKEFFKRECPRCRLSLFCLTNNEKAMQKIGCWLDILSALYKKGKTYNVGHRKSKKI